MTVNVTSRQTSRVCDVCNDQKPKKLTEFTIEERVCICCVNCLSGIKEGITELDFKEGRWRIMRIPPTSGEKGADLASSVAPSSSLVVFKPLLACTTEGEVGVSPNYSSSEERTGVSPNSLFTRERGVDVSPSRSTSFDMVDDFEVPNPATSPKDSPDDNDRNEDSVFQILAEKTFVPITTQDIMQIQNSS